MVTGKIRECRRLGLLIDGVLAPTMLIVQTALLLLPDLSLIPGIDEHSPVTLCFYFASLPTCQVVWSRKDVWRETGFRTLHLVAQSQLRQLTPDPRLERQNARPLRRVEPPQKPPTLAVLAALIVVPHVAVTAVHRSRIDPLHFRLERSDNHYVQQARRVARDELLHPNTVVRILEDEGRVEPLVPHLYAEALKDRKSLLTPAELVLHLDKVPRTNDGHRERSVPAHAVNLHHLQVVHDVAALHRRYGIPYLLQRRPAFPIDRILQGEDVL
mmetsp:Transcript_65383/g.142535  ORF Transcript_65383/g.142535 Transcript_65383/m.142535 type:complete len:271 (+) Transcript_65383:109-921(+)